MKILCPLMELMSRYNVNKHWQKQKVKSRMDSLETLATLGTQDTGQRQTKQKTQHRKLKR